MLFISWETNKAIREKKIENSENDIASSLSKDNKINKRNDKLLDNEMIKIE